jgi:hypothetical protein
MVGEPLTSAPQTGASMTTQPETDSALNVARDPSSTAEQLQACLGVAVEADRVIAGHANCGVDALRRLGTSSDSECRQAAIRHANFPPGDEMKALIQEFPGEFFKNPALDLFLLEDPSLLSGLEEILDAPNCPDSIINWYLNNGTLSAKQRICLNEIGSPQIREKVNAQFFEDDFKKQAHRLSTEHPDPVFREAFGNYTKKTRPCAYPRFMPQDRSNLAHRTHDMLGGFPYTSEEFPWPVSAEGHHMQPVVQINLKEAGTLLEEDIGSGLLQIWGKIFPDAKSRLDFVIENYSQCINLRNSINGIFLMRIIPLDRTLTSPSNVYPEISPWLPSTPGPNCESTLTSVIKHSLNQIENPLIRWERMAPMLSSIEEEDVENNTTVFLEDLAPESYETTGGPDQLRDFYEIVKSTFNTPNTFRRIYLGGLSPASEDCWSQSDLTNDPTLFCFSVEEDISISIFQDYLFWVTPSVIEIESGKLIHFSREEKLSLYFRNNLPS